MTTTTADVATMALEAVMRGEVDEAAALIRQLSTANQQVVRSYVGELFSIVIDELLLDPLRGRP